MICSISMAPRAIYFQAILLRDPVGVPSNFVKSQIKGVYRITETIENIINSHINK